MDRRSFCLSSASGAMALAAFGLSTARPAFGSPASPFAIVLIDSRFPVARAFGAAAARAGSSTAAVAGDLTEVWATRLKPHWTRAGAPVAGLTTTAGLFCLEQLAKDHWLRVVARAPIDEAHGPDPANLLSTLGTRPSAGPARAAHELVAWVIAKSQIRG